MLSNVEESDGGQYVCVASNAAGTTEYEFQLTVHIPPSLTYQPQLNHTDIYYYVVVVTYELLSYCSHIYYYPLCITAYTSTIQLAYTVYYYVVVVAYKLFYSFHIHY